MENFTFRMGVEHIANMIEDSVGFLSQNNSYSKKFLVKHLIDSRSIVIEQALKSGRFIQEHMVQVLPCVDMCEVDRASECPCTPESGCYWSKTVISIPKYLRIVSVTDTIANTTFGFLKWSRFKYIKHSRVESLKSRQYYTIKDTKEGALLYIYNNRFVENISVSFIAENPIEAVAFPCCGEIDKEAFCNPLDVNFYTDSTLRDAIFKLAWQTLPVVRQTALTDSQNDDMDIKNQKQQITQAK